MLVVEICVGTYINFINKVLCVKYKEHLLPIVSRKLRKYGKKYFDFLIRRNYSFLFNQRASDDVPIIVGEIVVFQRLLLWISKGNLIFKNVLLLLNMTL